MNRIHRLNRALKYDDDVLKDRFMTAIPTNIRQLAKISNPRTLKDCIERVREILEDSPIDDNHLVVVSQDNWDIGKLSLSLRNMQKDIRTLSSQVQNNQNEQARSNDTGMVNNRYDRSFQNRRYTGQPTHHYRQEGRYDPPPQWTPGPPHWSQQNSQEGMRQTRYQEGYNGFKNSVKCFICKKLGHYSYQCQYSHNGYQQNYYGPPNGYQSNYQSLQNQF